MAVSVGERSTGRDLRFLRPLYVRLAGDITTQSNDVLTDVPGLAFSLRPGARYLLDGYIAYTSATDADLKLALTGMSGVFSGATFAFVGVVTGGTSSGDLHGIRHEDLNTPTASNFSSFAGAGTSTGMFCSPCGHFRARDLPVLIQLQFCQATSTASATTIKAGSWLRLTQMAV
jgi:hypothetical protein